MRQKEDLQMSKKIYIGNLSYATTEETLSSTFASYGDIVSTVIIRDRDTQQSKGFGFVELTDEAMADRAVAELSGKEIDGRRVRVNIAEERPRKNENRGERNFSKGPRQNYRRNDRRDFNDNSF